MVESRTEVALAAWQLQNTYAHAIDTRDWELFRSAFAPDVTVHTDRGVIEGMDAWLEYFIPFHDDCEWTLHTMTNHRVSDGPDGVRATCYGDIRWTHRAQPDTFKRAASLYQDVLTDVDGSWRISQRSFKVLLTETLSPMPAGLTLWNSVLDLAGGSRAKDHA